MLFGLSSGLLILTKVFFSCVFLTLGVISVILFVISKNKNKITPFLKLSFSPFIVCIPYLFYTYSITGKIFYWSDAGGSSLYSMSTPYEDEYGDWFPASESFFNSPESLNIRNQNSSIKNERIVFIKSLDSLNGIEKDERLKSKALNNITNNKIKYLKNIIYNFGGMAFRYPFTRYEGPIILIIISVFHFSVLFFPFILSILKIFKNF